MSKSSILTCFSLICITPLLATNPSFPRAKEVRPDDCGNTRRPMRITARHMENKGIGYKTGYTTLEGFFASPPDFWSVMPFFDVKAHVFDNGRWAGNAGVGLRSLMKDRVYGAYSYYDFRITSKKDYHQVSFGMETMGTFWDVYLNGYVVLGSKKSYGYNPQFSKFSGNNIFYTERFQYALSGGNGEVGIHPLRMRNIDLYTGIGPYYLKGPIGSGVWGVETRAKVTWKNYVSAQISYSYDHVFKNIVQGEVGLSYSFGPKSKIPKRKDRSCLDSQILYDRMLQPVVKHEIIPVNTKKQKRVASDPTTGLPYTVFFVNNLSHSAGTFESPFATLLDAQNASGPNDIIYVYPGDLTSNGMSDGITLQSGQQLLGAATSQTLQTTAGVLTIPAQTDGSFAPLLSNTGGAVITAANNNTISGFYIQNTAGDGILASGTNNLNITNNYIQGNRSYNGVELDNVTGVVTINSNAILSQYNSILLNNTTPVSGASYLVTNNALSALAGDYNVVMNMTDSTNNQITLANNQMSGTDSLGVNIAVTNTALGAANIFQVTNNQISCESSYSFQLILSQAANCDLSLTDNIITTYTSDYACIVEANDSSNLVASINNNTISSNYYAIYLGTSSTSMCSANIENNILNSPYYTVDLENSDLSNFSANISNNTFNGSDTDVLLYWTIGDSATVNGTVSSNTFYGGNYTLDIGNSSTAPSTLSIVGNTLLNAEAPMIYVTNSASSQYILDISNNTLTGTNPTSAIQVINTGGNSCLQFNDNSCNFYPQAYALTGPGLSVVTPVGNLGQIVETNTTPVTSCQ